MNKVHYRTSGTLTGTIEPENVGVAQEYLTSDDMTQYIDDSIASAVFHVAWNLHADGHNYHIDAFCVRELTQDEQRVLSEWCSGQNSDGLGEGFEQQDFAWNTEGECGDCEGCSEGYECDDEGGSMISFDWQKNELPWTLVS